MKIPYLMDKPVPSLILAGLATAAIWRLAPIGDAPISRWMTWNVWCTRMVLGAEIGLLAISLGIGMHTVSACIVCGLVAAVLVLSKNQHKN